MTVVKLLSPLVAGLLALTACAGQAQPAADQGSVAEALSGRETDARSVADLDFRMATLDGSTFEGQSLAGKPAVLWFWAPWCPTCAAEAPQVNAAAKKYAGKLAVVGVAGLGEVDAMREFVKQTGVDAMPHLADEQGQVWRSFKVRAQSTFVLLDASGAVVYSGYLSPDDFDRLLAQLAA